MDYDPQNVASRKEISTSIESRLLSCIFSTQQTPVKQNKNDEFTTNLIRLHVEVICSITSAAVVIGQTVSSK